MNKKSKALVSSAVAIALCANVIAGATYALFTSESNVNIAVTSGTVAVKAGLSDLKYRTLTQTAWLDATDNQTTFDNLGGSAKIDGAKVTLNQIVPGDAVKFNVNITNESTVNVKYRVVVSNDETKDTGLFEALDVTVDGEEFLGEQVSDWTQLAPTDDIVQTVAVEIELPKDTTNDYQGDACEINVLVEALQGNTPVTDAWDGTTDTSWYDENASSFTLSKAAQIAGLSSLVNDGITFEDKIVQLAGHLDFYAPDGGANGADKQFYLTPIGTYGETSFEGTFDGKGCTVKNIYQEGWVFSENDDSTIGLFGSVTDAVIKNLTLDNSLYYMQGWAVGGITGYAEGNCTFDNITVSGCTMSTGNDSAGGIVGRTGEGSYTFSNITIDENTILSGLWGNFDSALGGIVGSLDETATASFQNITVAARIDAYNDLMASNQWTLYRYSGMLVGYIEKEQVINGNTYPDPEAHGVVCSNVKAIYGEWAKYHYCKTGSRWSRVEAGYRYSGHNIADCTHSDSCNELFVFDQLFGGSGGVRGLTAYDGVEVVYNYAL